MAKLVRNEENHNNRCNVAEVVEVQLKESRFRCGLGFKTCQLSLVQGNPSLFTEKRKICVAVLCVLPFSILAFPRLGSRQSGFVVIFSSKSEQLEERYQWAEQED